MMRIAVLALLLRCFTPCSSNEVLVDGESTTRTVFCVGEALTFISDVPSLLYAWSIPPLITGTTLQIVEATPQKTIMGFTATYVSANKSTLEFNATMELNGTNITSVDSLNNQLLFSMVLNLYGNLFIPMVTTVQNNISSINLTITQPGDSAICVRNYNITVTSMDSRIQQSVIHTRKSSPTTVVIDNLQFCLYNSTVQVFAIALSGSMSEPFVYMENITSGGDLFIPVVTIVQNTISSLNLTITQPGESAICVRDYQITITSIASTYQQSVMFAVNSSPTIVVIGNLQLCLYNYTVQVVAIDWSGSMSKPFTDIGNITPRSNLHLSNLIFEMSVVKWSIPPELMDCITGYEYSFQYSGVSGVLPANTNMLSLDMLNISTPCNVDSLTIAPLFHMQPHPIRRSSIMRCISTASELSMTTGSLETTREIPFGSQNQCQFCVGAIIGIILMGVVIIVLLAVVIAVQAVKIKELKSKTIVTQSNEDTKNKDAQYDEVKLYKRSDKLKTRNLSEGLSEIAMVGCQAYGTVSVQQSLPGVGERSAGVYEAV